MIQIFNPQMVQFIAPNITPTRLSKLVLSHEKSKNTIWSMHIPRICNCPLTKTVEDFVCTWDISDIRYQISRWGTSIALNDNMTILKSKFHTKNCILKLSWVEVPKLAPCDNCKSPLVCSAHAHLLHYSYSDFPSAVAGPLQCSGRLLSTSTSS